MHESFRVPMSQQRKWVFDDYELTKQNWNKMATELCSVLIIFLNFRQKAALLRNSAVLVELHLYSISGYH